MKRLSAAVVVLSFLCTGSMNVGFSADGGYYCPPGAKFCPIPPSGSQGGGSGMDASFGLDSGNNYASAPSFSSSSGSGVQSHFENQLNDGEQLIMVAPNQQNGMIIVPNPEAYGHSFTGLAAQAVYGDAYSSPSPGYSDYSSSSYSSSASIGEPYSLDSASSSSYSGMSEPYSLDSYSSEPVYSSEPYSSDTYSASPVMADSGYSSSPVYSTPNGFASSGGYASSGFADHSANDFDDDFDDDFSDSGSSPFGGGYIPPPPGGSGGFSSGGSDSSFAARSAPPPPPMGSGSGMLYDEAFGDDSMDAAPQKSTGRNYRPKNKKADNVASAPAPASAATYDRVRGESRNVSYDGRDYEVSHTDVNRGRSSDSIPSREDVAKVRGKRKRADILSEVANETSRNGAAPAGKRGGSSAQYSRMNDAPAERVPWWKGGMWRNRKANQAEREAAKAEAKARKEAAKAARQKR